MAVFRQIERTTRVGNKRGPGARRRYPVTGLARERRETTRGGGSLFEERGWFRGMDTTGLYGHGNGYSAIACNPISTDAIYPIYHTLLSGALSTPAAALDRLTLVLIEFAQRGVALRAFRPTMFFPIRGGWRGGKGWRRPRRGGCSTTRVTGGEPARILGRGADERERDRGTDG